MSVPDRIRDFQKKYDLTNREMAIALRTPIGTFHHWIVSGDVRPPNVMLLVMELLERSKEARQLAGIADIDDAQA